MLKKGMDFKVLSHGTCVEMTWIVLRHKNLSMLIGAVYRPPNSDIAVLEALQDFLLEQSKRYTHILVGGDLNLPKINWDNFCVTTPCQHSELLLDIAFSCSMTQLVKTPTRVTAGTSSILDLIFVSESICKFNNTIEVVPGISDHELVLFKTNMLCTLSVTQVSRFLNFNTASDESILDLLEEEYDKITNKHLHNRCDVNQLW